MINPDYASASAAPPITCDDTARYAAQRSRRHAAPLPSSPLASLPCASPLRSCLIDRLVRPQATR
eukprot:5344499-Pleurochrysis_carterae.AAC.1